MLVWFIHSGWLEIRSLRKRLAKESLLKRWGDVSNFAFATNVVDCTMRHEASNIHPARQLIVRRHSGNYSFAKLIVQKTVVNYLDIIAFGIKRKLWNCIFIAKVHNSRILLLIMQNNLTRRISIPNSSAGPRILGGEGMKKVKKKRKELKQVIFSVFFH